MNKIVVSILIICLNCIGLFSDSKLNDFNGVWNLEDVNAKYTILKINNDQYLGNNVSVYINLDSENVNENYIKGSGFSWRILSSIANSNSISLLIQGNDRGKTINAGIIIHIRDNDTIWFESVMDEKTLLNVFSGGWIEYGSSNLYKRANKIE
jgi:hypothetical protein